MPTAADSRVLLNNGSEMTGYPPAGLPVAPTNDPIIADNKTNPQVPGRPKMLGLVTDSPTAPTKLTLSWAINKSATDPLGWAGTALPSPPVPPGTGKGYIDQSAAYVMPGLPTPDTYNIYRVLRAPGGSPAYVFVANQSGLTKDLPLPTSPGVYEYTATGVCAASGTLTGGESAFPAVNPQYVIAGIPVQVDVTSPGDKTFTAGVAITNITLAASGGSAPYTWGISPALPAGVVLNTSTGVISGTPTTNAGIAITAYTVTATEAGGASSQATFNVTVNPVAPAAPGTTASSAITTTSVTLTWTAPGSGATPTGYKVYDTTASRPGTLLTGPITGLTYTATNGVTATTRKYAVSAMNGATEGPQNADLSVTFS